MKQKRFSYGLQPVLLTRGWELERLSQALAEANGVVAACAARLAQLRSALAAAADAWHGGLEQQFSVDTLALASRYGQDLARQVQVEQRLLARAEQERDDLQQQVVLARRKLDAIEQHRGDSLLAFHKVQAGAQCQEADDQWLMRRQAGSAP